MWGAAGGWLGQQEERKGLVFGCWKMEMGKNGVAKRERERERENVRWSGGSERGEISLGRVRVWFFGFGWGREGRGELCGFFFQRERGSRLVTVKEEEQL